jgi:hypothetical protein
MGSHTPPQTTRIAASIILSSCARCGALRGQRCSLLTTKGVRPPGIFSMEQNLDHHAGRRGLLRVSYEADTPRSQRLLQPPRPARASCGPVQGRDPAAGARHSGHDHGHGKRALNSIRAYLDPGESAVGTAVNVRHLAATPVGSRVTGEAEVTKVDGRQIEFTVRATEGAKEIGAGSHCRVVIDVAKFTRRLE